MAYNMRGRGPRTRGGMQRGRMLDQVSSRYARSDSNVFSCLRYLRGTGSASESENVLSSDTDSDTDQLNQSSMRATRHQKKRKLNGSSGGGSKLMEEGSEDDAVDYDTLETEEKLNLILSKVTLNEKRFKNLESICGSVVKHSKRLTKIETVIKSHEDRIRLIEYKSIDLEARSRRNNILFYGLSESRNEDCKNIIVDNLRNELNITIQESDISRAHRLGRYEGTKKRPVIVAFQSYVLAESIIKQGYKLKDTDFSISRDYPLEITRARRTLWPEYKQIKSQHPLAKVAIVYPAKLLVNGRVEKDMFPEWDTVLSGSRIDMTHESQSSFAKKLGILQTNQGPFDLGSVASTSTPRYVNHVTIDINREVAAGSQPLAGSSADSISNRKSTVPLGASSSANGVGNAASRRPGSSSRRLGSPGRSTSRSRSRTRSFSRNGRNAQPSEPSENQSPNQTDSNA